MRLPDKSPLRLRGEITLLLALKAAVLALLWYLFFSPAHRTPVDGEVTGARFGLNAAANGRVEAPAPRLMEKTHD